MEEYYPPRYDPSEGWQAKLGFALRHEGIELGILAELFAALEPGDMAAWISIIPTGKYAGWPGICMSGLLEPDFPCPTRSRGITFPSSIRPRTIACPAS
ncbi:MAG: hypothetical protein ABIJ86_16150, partial [Spirochaetota bacterium]